MSHKLMQSSYHRYSRQIRLSEIGPGGQERLKKSHILVVGAGGLGSPALLYLTAGGIGQITLIDDDTIDGSNLQRQILFADRDVGQKKVKLAKKRIQAQNPEIKISAVDDYLKRSNIVKLLKGIDLVIDGSDNFETKFLINEACRKFEIPWIYAAANQFEGQIAYFDSKTGPCYRCNFSQPSADVQNCDTAGVLGSVVGTLGTLQATLAIQILIARHNQNHALQPPHNVLHVFDFCGDWQIKKLTLKKNLSCPVCSVDRALLLTQNDMSLQDELEISNSDFLKKIKRQKVILIDVRSQAEARRSQLKSALHIPLSEIKNSSPRYQKYIKNSKLDCIVYCESGIRSRKAAQILRTRGRHNTWSLRGGIRGIEFRHAGKARAL